MPREGRRAVTTQHDEHVESAGADGQGVSPILASNLATVSADAFSAPACPCPSARAAEGSRPPPARDVEEEKNRTRGIHFGNAGARATVSSGREREDNVEGARNPRAIT